MDDRFLGTESKEVAKPRQPIRQQSWKRIALESTNPQAQGCENAAKTGLSLPFFRSSLTFPPVITPVPFLSSFFFPRRAPHKSFVRALRGNICGLPPWPASHTSPHQMASSNLAYGKARLETGSAAPGPAHPLLPFCQLVRTWRVRRSPRESEHAVMPCMRLSPHPLGRDMHEALRSVLVRWVDGLQVANPSWRGSTDCERLQQTPWHRLAHHPAR